MLRWLRRGQTLHNGRAYHLRLAVNSYARAYSTEAALPTSAAPTRHDHALNKAPTRAQAYSERSLRARHILRGLLRECSYLPDPASKQYLSQHILSQFRTYGYRAWKHRDDPEYDTRLQEKERQAKISLNQLRRANDGELKPLLKVLFMTYGRIGRRRYELMEPLMPKAASEEIKQTSGVAMEIGPEQIANETNDLGDDADALPQSAEGMMSAIDTPKALPQLTPALYALAKSQIRTSPTTMTRPNPRSLRPEIPKLNAKMRPMPKSRVKNMTKEWYANTLHRLLPPLPTREWYGLQKLAAGQDVVEQLSKRRKRPNAAPVDQGSALERVLMRGTFDIPNPTTSEAHTLTPRFMQRVYAAVFGQCPRMDWDSQKERWDVQWGSQTLCPPRTSVRP